MAQDNDMFNDSLTDPATISEVANDDEPLFEQSWFEEIGSPVDFDDPKLLAALALLIPFYMIMRSIPPRPKEEDFPFIRMLLDLNTEEQEADKMPWWQRSVNLAVVSAIALAAAGPSWVDNPEFEAEGPILIAVDNGWAAAPNWEARLEEMRDIIRHAHNQDRSIVVMPTAPSQNNTGVEMTMPMDTRTALDYIENLQPFSWNVDHVEANNVLDTLDGQYGATFWLSNGLQDEGSLDFAVNLNAAGPLTVLDNGDQRPVHLMTEPEFVSGSYNITVQRSEIPETEYPLSISAYTEDNILIARQQLNFEDDALSGTVSFDGDFRNSNGHGLDDVFRFAIDGEKSAGAVALVDEQWQPRTVGLAVQSDFDVTSLLGEGYYINIALSEQADVVVNNIEALINSGEVSVLMVPDSVIISELVREELQSWVQNGGTLVRFAGPNLARDPHNNDPLLPVDLRRGFRSLEDTVLSDDDAQGQIQQFSENSPFYATEIDENVRITTQILAQPGPETDGRIWARLNDGTPLVSANDLGDGQVIFYHTTANTQGSDLPLSPMFIDMLVDIVQQSNSVENTSDYVLPAMPPLSTLDGFGDLEAPLSITGSISQEIVDRQDMGPLYPPGLYGNSVTRYAYNVSDVVQDVTELGALPESIARQSYEESADGVDLKHPLFASAMGLLLLSQLILFAQQGHFDRKGARRRRVNATRDAVGDQNNAEFNPNSLDI